MWEGENKSIIYIIHIWKMKEEIEPNLGILDWQNESQKFKGPAVKYKSVTGQERQRDNIKSYLI